MTKHNAWLVRPGVEIIDMLRNYGQFTPGLNGAKRPEAFGSYSQTCRVQWGTGIGEPPSSNV